MNVDVGTSGDGSGDLSSVHGADEDATGEALYDALDDGLCTAKMQQAGGLNGTGRGNAGIGTGCFHEQQIGSIQSHCGVRRGCAEACTSEHADVAGCQAEAAGTFQPAFDGDAAGGGTDGDAESIGNEGVACCLPAADIALEQHAVSRQQRDGAAKSRANFATGETLGSGAVQFNRQDDEAGF